MCIFVQANLCSAVPESSALPKTLGRIRGRFRGQRRVPPAEEAEEQEEEEEEDRPDSTFKFFDEVMDLFDDLAEDVDKAR